MSPEDSICEFECKLVCLLPLEAPLWDGLDVSKTSLNIRLFCVGVKFILFYFNLFCLLLARRHSLLSHCSRGVQIACMSNVHGTRDLWIPLQDWMDPHLGCLFHIESYWRDACVYVKWRLLCLSFFFQVKDYIIPLVYYTFYWPQF